LVLVDDEMFNFEQVLHVETARRDVIDGFSNDLTGKNARVRLRSRSVKCVEAVALACSDGRIGRDEVGRSPVSGAPEGLVLEPDLLTSTRCCSRIFRVLDFEDVSEFPVIENHGTCRVRRE